MSKSTAVLFSVVITLGFAPSSAAQGWEFMVTNGRMIPTGAQRQAVAAGNITAAQAWFLPRPSVAVTASVGWARSHDLSVSTEPKLDVFTYDVGAEVRAPKWMQHRTLSLTPFAGLGLGGRSSDVRGTARDATHRLAAYAGAGGEIRVRRVAVRLELRDYVSGTSASRNDVMLLAGLRLGAR